MNSGIYKITNTITNKFYIGSAKDFDTRWNRHRSNLSNGTHCNVYLQRSYNKYGDVFEYSILEYALYDSYIEALEQQYIDKLDARNPDIGYNLAPASFGDILTKHPDRELIIEKIRNTVKTNCDNMTEEERKLKWSHYGEDNPRWDPNKVRACIDCGTPINKRSENFKRCKPCDLSNRSGENNSFYGKTHTTEAKQKMADARKGISPGNIISVTIDGTTYKSAKHASDILGIKPGTIRHRCLSKNKKFENYILNA